LNYFSRFSKKGVKKGVKGRKKELFANPNPKDAWYINTQGTGRKIDTSGPKPLDSFKEDVENCLNHMYFSLLQEVFMSTGLTKDSIVV
jgi:hypothetical protein